jgi:hypothetical protein
MKIDANKISLYFLLGAMGLALLVALLGLAVNLF